MQSITFALPSLDTVSMSRADQNDILLNQATAAIVCCYLEHMNKALDKDLFTATGVGQFQPATPGRSYFEQSELISLINDVQAALRSI